MTSIAVHPRHRGHGGAADAGAECSASRALAQATPSPDALAAANELFTLILSKDMVDQIARSLMSCRCGR